MMACYETNLLDRWRRLLPLWRHLNYSLINRSFASNTEHYLVNLMSDSYCGGLRYFQIYTCTCVCVCVCSLASLHTTLSTQLMSPLSPVSLHSRVCAPATPKASPRSITGKLTQYTTTTTSFEEVCSRLSWPCVDSGFYWLIIPRR
jgi:hypothetical protein